MKLSHLKIGLLLSFLLVTASGCGYINSIRAKSQLNEAVSAYKDKKYDEAEKYARKAIYLDPANENAPMILAIILQTEYRRGDVSDLNVGRAEEAINLYKQMYEKDPNNDDLFTAVTGLYGYLIQAAGQHVEQLNDQISKAGDNQDQQGKLTAEKSDWENKQTKWTEDQTNWVVQRSKSENVAKSKRSDAYAFLANKKWDCSLAITTKHQQSVAQPDGSTVIKYKKAEDPAEYQKAVQCMTEGLDLAKTAIDLDPESETAWAQRYNLLLEAGKLAKMEGNESKATDLEKQATEAANKVKELHAKSKPAPSPQPAS